MNTSPRNFKSLLVLRQVKRMYVSRDTHVTPSLSAVFPDVIPESAGQRPAQHLSFTLTRPPYSHSPAYLAYLLYP